MSPAPRTGPGPGPGSSPFSDAELDELQALLDGVPSPLDPLDTSMLDGFLCGVLVQPAPITAARWLPFVTDSDGRPLPHGFDASRLHALALRRHAELDGAIEARRWFDPWIFEVEADAVHPEAAGADPDDADDRAPSEAGAVYPWVAGFVTALDRFPALMSRAGPALDAALVLLYRHLDPDDLEDADEILQAIDELEPPENLGVAVEELVRATLLLADIGRPRREGSRRPARKGRPRR